MLIDWLNRLCKYRSILTGRILGTVSAEDPRAQGFRDIFDKLLILRAEVTAITGLLIEKQLTTSTDLLARMHKEAEELCKMYQRAFPGTEPTDAGVAFTDIDKVKEWISKFPK